MNNEIPHPGQDRISRSVSASIVHTFKVVKEPHGWSVRLGERMVTPFRARNLAIQEANCLCDALRSHGQAAEVLIEEIELANTAGLSDRFAIPGLPPRLTSNRPAER